MTDEKAIRQIFERIRRDVMDISGIALVSSDGCIIVSDWYREVEPDKVGALAAALLGLGAKAIQTLAAGEFQQVVLQASDGMLAIYHVGYKAVLIVQANKNANLGFINLVSREAAQHLVPLVDEEL